MNFSAERAAQRKKQTEQACCLPEDSSAAPDDTGKVISIFCLYIDDKKNILFL